MYNQFLIAAHPRSGSTYLCHLLRQFEQLTVLLEIFHTNPDVIKQHLGEAYLAVIEKFDLTVNDEFFRKEIITQDGQYTQLLAKLNPNKTLAYKVFPGHLPPKHLKNQIENSLFVIVLKRNLLHSYISDVIATDSQKWSGIDTSTSLASFSKHEFMQHLNRTQRFYKHVTDIAKAHSKKVININYEDLKESDRPYIYLSDLLAGSLKLAPHTSLNTFSNSLQDKRDRAKAKVVNSRKMNEFLNSVGLAGLDNSKHYCADAQYTLALEHYKQQKLKKSG